MCFLLALSLLRVFASAPLVSRFPSFPPSHDLVYRGNKLELIAAAPNRKSLPDRLNSTRLSSSSFTSLGPSQERLRTRTTSLLRLLWLPTRIERQKTTRVSSSRRGTRRGRKRKEKRKTEKSPRSPPQFQPPPPILVAAPCSCREGVDRGLCRTERRVETSDTKEKRRE